MDKNFDGSEMLQDLDAGVFCQKFSRVLAEVAIAACEHGRKGEVTLTFSMKQMGDSSQVMLSHSIKKSKPTRRGTAKEDDTTATPMYVGPNGTLSVMPFNQGRLFGEARQEEASE